MNPTFFTVATAKKRIDEQFTADAPKLASIKAPFRILGQTGMCNIVCPFLGQHAIVRGLCLAHNCPNTPPPAAAPPPGAGDEVELDIDIFTGGNGGQDDEESIFGDEGSTEERTAVDDASGFADAFERTLTEAGGLELNDRENHSAFARALERTLSEATEAGIDLGGGGGADRVLL